VRCDRVFADLSWSPMVIGAPSRRGGAADHVVVTEHLLSAAVLPRLRRGRAAGSPLASALERSGALLRRDRGAVGAQDRISRRDVVEGCNELFGPRVFNRHDRRCPRARQQ
jgi:hypothetical protein